MSQTNLCKLSCSSSPAFPIENILSRMKDSVSIDITRELFFYQERK